MMLSRNEIIYCTILSCLLQADVSDEEEKDVDDVVLVPDDKYSAQSLDKMINLVAVLVEKSRIDRQLHLSVRDTQALIGGGKVCCATNIIAVGISQLAAAVFLSCRGSSHVPAVCLYPKGFSHFVSLTGSALC